jgi:hypothetical protein
MGILLDVDAGLSHGVATVTRRRTSGPDGVIRSFEIYHRGSLR